MAGKHPHVGVIQQENSSWPAPGSGTGQLRLNIRPPARSTVSNRILMHPTSAPNIRRVALTVLHRLPAEVRHRATRLARTADPRSGG